MLDVVSKLTNAAGGEPQIMSVSVMQQSVSAVNELSSVLTDYDPATFISTLDMSKIVDNMELSVSDLGEEVHYDISVNSYT